MYANTNVNIYIYIWTAKRKAPADESIGDSAGPRRSKACWNILQMEQNQPIDRSIETMGDLY